MSDPLTRMTEQERGNELDKILEALKISATPETMQSRVTLCRRALELVDRNTKPAIWAWLNHELGVDLADSPSGDRAQNLEEAIMAYGRMLEVVKREKSPLPWATTMMNVANVYAQRARGNRADNVELALEKYDEALEVLSRDDHPVQWARATLNKSRAFEERLLGEKDENVTIAVKLREEVLEWARARIEGAGALIDRADPQVSIEERRDLIEDAIKGYEQVLEVLQREDAPSEWMAAKAHLGHAFLMRLSEDTEDNLQRAIDICKECSEAIDRRAQPVAWAMNMVHLSTAYFKRFRDDRATNLELAIHYLGEALKALTREQQPYVWASVKNDIGTAYGERLKGSRAENIERAIDAYKEALQERKREVFPLEWAQTTLNLATSFTKRIRGDRTENLEIAISQLYKAFEILTPRNAPSDWASAMNNLGLSYVDRILGDPAENIEKAIEAYQSALERRTRSHFPADWAQTMNNLGIAYSKRIKGQRAQNMELAIKAYENALEVVSRPEMPMLWARVMGNLATAYVERVYGDKRENQEKAIRVLNDVLHVRTRESMPVEWANTMLNLGTIHRDRGEMPFEAVSAYRKALEVFTKEAMPGQHREVQLLLGSLHFAHGEWTESIEAFRSALSAHELLYQTASTPESRQVELQPVSRTPASLAFSLLKRAKAEDTAAAVLALENGRARFLAEVLSLDEAPLDQVQVEDRRLFEEIRGRIRDLQSEARLPEDTPARRSFLELSRELRMVYGELETIIDRIREYVPGFFPGTRLEDIQAAAAVCPVMYVFSTELGGMALNVDGRREGEVSTVWLPDLTQHTLQESLTGYFESYAKWHASPGDQIRQEAWWRVLDSTLNWLWEVAMGRVVEAIAPAEEVVLIPIGLLGLLPLHAAWRPDADAVTGRRYAFDTVTFRYAPSARALVSAEESAAQVSPDAILAVDEPKPVSGSALPNSEREVQSAVSHFERRRVLQHEAATRDALQAELAKYPVLHFSCHGFADFGEPLDGGLAMANDEILSLRGLLDTRLPKARLAVLSACETAIPGAELPDEVLSLPTGLMQAGVDGVAGSLWSVQDESTMILMSRFYDLWRDEGLRPAEALRRAQQWVRDTTNGEKVEYFKGPLPEFSGARMAVETADSLYKLFSIRDPQARDFSHPYHWAAFCYVGV